MSILTAVRASLKQPGILKFLRSSAQLNPLERLELVTFQRNDKNSPYFAEPLFINGIFSIESYMSKHDAMYHLGSFTEHF